MSDKVSEQQILHVLQAMEVTSGSSYDDSDKDPDYKSDSSSCEEGNVASLKSSDAPSATSAAAGASLEGRAETWKQKKEKNRRLHGQQYESRFGVEKKAKAIGDPCKSSFCKRSKLRNCDLIEESARQKIFEWFWNMNSWNEKKTFVKALVSKTPKKQKVAAQSTKRETSCTYNLKKADGTLIPVCKEMFSSTLGVSKKTISNWISEESVPKPSSSKRSQGFASEEGQETLTFLYSWLENLPTVPSHYCRNNPAYQRKKFLEPGTTISHLYEEYKKDALASNKTAVGVTVFKQKFHQLNFSIFIPRKDQCDVCIAAKQGNLSQETYNEHQASKNLAREEKNKDKEQANDEIAVWTMDLQAVLICPKSPASSMYYKQKLQVHNFTLYNLASKDGYCYVWKETEGNLSSEMFSYIIHNHFKQRIEKNKTIKKIIIWSDGCGYQNRNATLSGTLLELAMSLKVSIEQKYLVSGHTQMECDSMHSVIERKLPSEIYTHRDYIVVMKAARTCPKPYNVIEIKAHEVMKISNPLVTSIRPGKRVGDQTVHDLRALKYDSDGTIAYKTNFLTSWQNLPQRIQLPAEIVWEKVFQCEVPLTKRKYDDLMALKKILPQDTHYFYDNLRH